MQKNFEGNHFTIETKNQPNIDCMFFTSTVSEKVHLDPFTTGDVSQISAKYLSKSTILMCNPNAMIYQQMITQANAYWLDFFLKRDCNVFIWNYRGYGGSE